MAVRVKIGRKCAFRILASMIHFIAAGWRIAGGLSSTIKWRLLACCRG
ncbi:MAG: hypothetical protein Q7J77_02485 [Undibacterium sp.]|nr:hypothetical protein [Undibacterium sp.]